MKKSNGKWRDDVLNKIKETIREIVNPSGKQTRNMIGGGISALDHSRTLVL